MSKEPQKRRVIIEEAPYLYYDPEYADQVAQLAKDLIIARDKYLAAWLAWSQCALGAGLDPETESDIMKGIMEDVQKTAAGREAK